MSAVATYTARSRVPRSLDTTTRTAGTSASSTYRRTDGSPERLGRAVYWRRRIVALTVMAGVLAVVPAAGAIVGGSGRDGGPVAPTHHLVVKTYVIQPGDSLWTAARHLAPATDPRKVVQALEEARHGHTLVSGEILTWAP